LNSKYFIIVRFVDREVLSSSGRIILVFLQFLFCSKSSDTPKRIKWKIEDQKQFFLDLSSKMGGMETLYNLTVNDIQREGGGGFLRSHYNDSPSEALNFLFPEHKWQFWNFSTIPLGFWHDLKNQRLYLYWIYSEYNLSIPSQSYQLGLHHFRARKGSGLLYNVYRNSVSQAIVMAFPEFEWIPWAFHKVPNKFWKNRENHKMFFDFLGRKLNITCKSGWYDVTHQKIEDLGGSSILTLHYNNSALQALSSVYPDHEWEEWRFSSKWLDSPIIMRKFLFKCARGLGIEVPHSLYSVESYDIEKQGIYDSLRFLSHTSGNMKNLFKNLNKLPSEVISHVFVELSWEMWHFLSIPKSFWADRNNHQKYFEWLESSLGFQTPQDWYTLNHKPLNYSQGVVNELVDYSYKGSKTAALAAIFPDKMWNSWLGKGKNDTFWSKGDNYSNYFSWFYEEFALRGDLVSHQREFFFQHRDPEIFYLPQDLYKFKMSNIKQMGGDGIVHYLYGGSLR